MDFVPSSRKRNRTTATLTRSRLHLLLHRIRSGQLQFDPIQTHDEPYPLDLHFHQINCKRPKRDHNQPPRLLTKDLRAKRVYSPPLSTNSVLIRGTYSKEIIDDSNCTDGNVGEDLDLRLSGKARTSYLKKVESLEESIKLQDCRRKNDGYCLEKIDGLDVSLVPTTLPDAEVCVGSTFKYTPSSGKDKSKNGSSLMNKIVLRPRVQGKLFKAPEIKCLSESKVDATADYGVNAVGSDFPNDGSNQLSNHRNNIDCAVPSYRACTSSEFGVFSEECILTTAPDADFYDNSEVNVKPMDLTRSTEVNAGERFCLKADLGKDSLEGKCVPRQRLHSKLFKTLGSVSYKRLLPFLMDLTKDYSGTSKFDNETRHQEEKEHMHPKSFQRPLSSQSEEASLKGHKTDGSPMHATVESHGVENYVLVYPSKELSHDNQPNLTPSQVLPELPTHLDSKEVVGEGLSAPSVNEHTEKMVNGECLSASELNPCSVMEDDFHSAKEVANVALAHNENLQEVQNKISKRHDCESPPKDHNRLYVKGDISEFTFVHHSNIEKGLTIDCDENKQFVNLEERESVNIFPQEGQSLCHLDPNVLDVDENVTSLNHALASNDILRSPEKIMSRKSDMTGHCGDKEGSGQNVIVLYSRMPSEGSDNNKTSEIVNDSESKNTPKQVLERCLQFKLLKQAGSLNCKRLLPFLLNTMKDNSCHSGTQHQIGLNNYSSSRKFQIPVFQSSHDSCEVIQLQDKQVVLNGFCKPESSTDPSISSQERELPIIGTMIKEVITKKEKATPPLSKSSVFSEVKGNGSLMMSSSEKPPETHKCCESLSELKVVGGPAVGLRKGILKRNPRGCRGLCACLNCVSFRLHAERAFEFSKSQLLDAKEVAHDLMKELSHLRNMLERYADNVNINQVFDASQVKEACRKAYAVEELAKDRLNQMHDDLNIRSRITRLQAPRVTFAVHVEENTTQPGG
ncbi:unnamed protein product [Sphenostylis stenocarpa]|uniref:Uncharacterized protein n=1 Tax=Sphenostylis stenocarpa TaxID=92480 RepID=A0AA86VC77_9FABA|nr:unnamed protein product [Sphenostylis stenocarpa]